MNLHSIDRLALLQILPAEGDFLTLCCVKDIKAKLEFSKEEREKLEFKPLSNGGMQWNSDEDVPIDVSFDEAEAALLGTTLEKLNKDKKLTIDHLGVYRKFASAQGEGAK